MSEIKVNKISPRTACGTVTLGDSGDTFTIPSGATITNSGTASGFGATGETSWDTTVKTTGTFTATAGVGYFLNTTGGIITVNLPAGAAGSSVALADYAATWQTNNVTVTPNGSEKMGGQGGSVTLNTEGQSVTFVYIDGTQGWVNVIDSTSNVRSNPFIIATGGTPCTGQIVCTNYKQHTFTGPGTLCVSNAGSPSGSTTIDYLIVAGGGGGGGGNDRGGGAGAGGFRASATTFTNSGPSAPLTPTAGPTAVAAITAAVQGYPIAVGGGGAGTPAGPPAATGTSGAVASFASLTGAGGGGGGSVSTSGADGGSGGGAGGGGPATTCNGSGNTPPVAPPQGNNGGGAPGNPSSGGGGAIAVGANGGGDPAGAGGAGGGFPGTVYGSNGQCSGGSRYFSGGGGGGGHAPATSGAGGLGGGGAGGPGPSCHNGIAGTPNTGGGGGGGSNQCGGLPAAGGNGGSGIVVIRYKFQ